MKIQRVADTCSPSDTAATNVTTSGVSITMAVTSPTGIRRRLRNENRLTSNSSSPRTTCSHGRRVRSSERPRLGSSVAPVATIWNR